MPARQRCRKHPLAMVRRSPSSHFQKNPSPNTGDLDRKSTRLNSSHRCISYDVLVPLSFPTRRSSDLACIGAVFDTASPAFGELHLSATLLPSGMRLGDASAPAVPQASAGDGSPVTFEPLPEEP